MVDKVHKQKTGKLNDVSFDKIVKMSCHNHGYLVKHTLEECDLIKRYFSGEYKVPTQTHHPGPQAMRRRGMHIPTQKGAS
jgi:hypothetical protein